MLGKCNDVRIRFFVVFDVIDFFRMVDCICELYVCFLFLLYDYFVVCVIRFNDFVFVWFYFCFV